LIPKASTVMTHAAGCAAAPLKADLDLVDARGSCLYPRVVSPS
jgi:hypothetical protein